MRTIVKCAICHLEYDQREFKCPNCGLNNPIHQAKQCAVCGTIVESGEKFCSGCGASQIQSAPTHCGVCEASLKPGATFCTQCGSKVGSAAPPVVPTSVSVDTSYTQASQVVNAAPEPKIAAVSAGEAPSLGEETANPTIMSSQEYLNVPPEITSDVMGRTIRTKEEPSLKEERRDQSPLIATVVPDVIVGGKEAVAGSDVEFRGIVEEEVPQKAPMAENGRGQEYSGANDPKLAAELARRADELGQQELLSSQRQGGEGQGIPPMPSFEEKKTAYASSIIDDIDQLNNKEEGTSRLHDELFSIDDSPIVSDYGILDVPPVKKKTGRVLMGILIVIILLMLGALAFIWFKLLPDGFKIGVGEPKVPTVSSVETSEGAPSVPNEPSNGSAARAGNYSYRANIVIPAIWEEIEPFDGNGIARVAINNAWGIIDRMGNDIVPPTYSIIGEFSEGLAFVVQNDKYGFIDTAGMVVIPLEYDLAHKFSDGLALVVEAEKYLYIDKTGEEFDFGGQPSTSFSEGIAAVNSDSGSYFIDVLGEKTSGDYEGAGRFSDGLAPVRVGGKWGYVNGAYDIVVECIFEEVSAFSNNVAVVTLGGKQLLVNSAGEIVSPEADKIWEMKEGIATAQVGGLYGYLDGFSEGFLIEPQYNDGLAFSGGMAPVKKGESWIYIDHSNQNVFEDKSFEEAYRFQDGFACVKIDGKYTMITKEGVPAFEDTWEKIETYSNGMIPFQSAGKWGFAEIYEM